MPFATCKPQPSITVHYRISLMHIMWCIQYGVSQPIPTASLSMRAIQNIYYLFFVQTVNLRSIICSAAAIHVVVVVQNNVFSTSAIGIFFQQKKKKYTARCVWFWRGWMENMFVFSLDAFLCLESDASVAIPKKFEFIYIITIYRKYLDSNGFVYTRERYLPAML